VTKEGSVEAIDWVSKKYLATWSGKGAGEALVPTLDFVSVGSLCREAVTALVAVDPFKQWRRSDEREVKGRGVGDPVLDN